MIRFFSGMIILLFLLGSVAGDDTAIEAPEPPLREVVWWAALQALEERGLVVVAALKEEGQIMTAFTSLDTAAVSKLTALNDQDSEAQWARAEYRYHIDIGGLSDDRERLVVKAEIWAWEREAQSSTPGPATKRALQSNNALEKEFVDAFNNALEHVMH